MAKRSGPVNAVPLQAHASPWNETPLAELVRAGREWLGAPAAASPGEIRRYDGRRIDVRLSSVQGAEDVQRAVEVHGLPAATGVFALVGLARSVDFTQPLAVALAVLMNRARCEGAEAAAEMDRLSARVLAGRHGERFRSAVEQVRPHPATPRSAVAPAPPAPAPPMDEGAARRAAARDRLKGVLPWLDQGLRPVLPGPVHPPPLDAADLHLALCWLGHPDGAKPVDSLAAAAQRYRGDYQLGRMLSARAAEKGAEAFYRDHGMAVRNVSLEQLNGGTGWLTHDLTANGRCVDVKNSRRSFSSPRAYVEHCVPAFKEARRGVDVVIAGVLSSWRSVPDLLSGDGDHPFLDAPLAQPVVFVGELTRARLAALQRCFPPRDHLRVDFARPGEKGEFFPPWVLDAPAFTTALRDEALARIPADAFADAAPWRELGLNPLPVAIAAGHPWTGGFEHAWEAGFHDSLRTALDGAARLGMMPRGLSLPFVFLAVLDHFTRVLARGSEVEGYTPAAYGRFLFLDPDDSRTPLGIPDPLETVHSLVHTLDLLWRGSREEAMRFRSFRLGGMRVLRGRREVEGAEIEQTLVAYCGGWTQSPAGSPVRCGKSPLVLEPAGSKACRPCTRCLRLVCPECLFCMRDCPEMAERREARAREEAEQGEAAPATVTGAGFRPRWE